MPQSTWTISNYFYHKQRYLYFIVFHNQHADSKMPTFSAHEELLACFAKHLPNWKTGEIFLFTLMAALFQRCMTAHFMPIFDEKSLARFVEVWED